MNTASISRKVHYIGVNDRTTHRFEGMWPLPYGVSYNSYLVAGNEKTAIIDGVEASHALRQIQTIKQLLGNRQPDYLVINHMEPDHSGTIAMLRQIFPDIIIVGNALTISMIKGFYGVTGNTLTINDGDTLQLGADTTLKFYLTPMVHWPETMMTYLSEDKTLFSGDAFGCFGALNGAVIDRDMDTGHYFPEMERYYTNIVGKYGAFVQKAIHKLDGVEIATICPTHGPVWHERIADVLDIYNRLSLYEPLDNGVTIVYGSMYGNTERMAEAAAATLAAEGVRQIDVFNASVTDISHIIAAIFRHKGLIIAAPTYSDGIFPPVAAVIDAIASRGIRNRETAILGSFTWSAQAAKNMAARLDACGIHLVSDPISAKQSPSPECLDKCRAAARAMAQTLLNE